MNVLIIAGCSQDWHDFEHTSTSQLSPLFPAHSSWRHTGTVWTHSHSLQDVSRSNSCNNIWWMSQLFVWPDRWCSTKDSRNSCDGVWWVEHTLYIVLYCLWLEQYHEWCVYWPYLQVLRTKVTFYTPKLLAAMVTHFQLVRTMTVHNTIHLFASGWKPTHSVAFGNTCYAKNCFSRLHAAVLDRDFCCVFWACPWVWNAIALSRQDSSGIHVFTKTCMIEPHL